MFISLHNFYVFNIHRNASCQCVIKTQQLMLMSMMFDVSVNSPCCINIYLFALCSTAGEVFEHLGNSGSDNWKYLQSSQFLNIYIHNLCASIVAINIFLKNLCCPFNVLILIRTISGKSIQIAAINRHKLPSCHFLKK